jgi:AbrB family looped-hinge helix DNA binding protein
MTVTTISDKGWIVVPQEFRDRYALSAGSKLEIVDQGSALLLIPLRPDPIQALHGMFADEPSLSQELLEEHHAERKRDEQRINPNLRPG